MGERVTLPSSTSPNLAGIIEVPDKAVRAWGVFSRGFTLGKDCPAAARTSEPLAADGTGMLRFDALGLGGSGGAAPSHTSAIQVRSEAHGTAGGNAR